MSSSKSDLHRQWRDAEKAYATVAAPFLKKPRKFLIGKRDLVDMVQLRGTADRARERYYRSTHAD